MKISPKDSDTLIKKPREPFLAYLLHGPDAGLIDERARSLAQFFSPNLDDPFSVSKVTGKEVQSDPALLADALSSMALIGTTKLVLLSGTSSELGSAVKANIDYLNTDCRLIITARDATTKHSLVTLCEKHPQIASIACYPDEDRNLQQFVRSNLSEHGINISSELIDYISEKLGGDRAINRSEIEKLALYAAHTKTIKHPEIDVLLGDNTSQLIDKLVNAVFDGKTEKLGFLLGKTKSEDIQPIVIIRYFQSYLRILIQVGAAKKSGLSTGAAISNLRPPIYFKRKNAVTLHSSVCSVEWCLALLNRFVLLEKQCKRGTNPDPFSLIGQSLLGIAISLSRQRV